MGVTDIANYNAIKQRRYRDRRRLRENGWANLDQSIARALAAIAISARRGVNATTTVTRHWDEDPAAELIVKAAVNPTSTATTALLPNIVGPFLRALAPTSAATRLFEQALQLDFAGVYQYVIPYPTAVPIPIFIAEGAPHPIVQNTYTTTTVGPTHKILIGSALTNELELYSADAAAEIIGNVLVDQVARNLDAYLFDAVASSAVRPPGLLNGVTPITAAPAGSTLAKDIAAIVSAITLAGGHLENIVFVGGAFASTALRLAAGPQFTFPIYGTGSVADKTIIGIDASAIASGYSGLPVIETTKQATVHMEDTNPLQLATGVQGSGVLATPQRSAFQTDTLLLRVRLNAAWAVLRPGAVQVINGVNW